MKNGGSWSSYRPIRWDHPVIDLLSGWCEVSAIPFYRCRKMILKACPLLVWIGQKYCQKHDSDRTHVWQQYHLLSSKTVKISCHSVAVPMSGHWKYRGKKHDIFPTYSCHIYAIYPLFFVACAWIKKGKNNLHFLFIFGSFTLYFPWINNDKRFAFLPYKRVVYSPLTRHSGIRSCIIGAWYFWQKQPVFSILARDYRVGGRLPIRL